MQNDSTAQEVWASAELLEATRNGFVIWGFVPGTNARYEVSNFGEVRSWNRKGTTARADSPTLLVCTPNSDGYPMFQVCANGKRTIKLVHVAMCEAFIGPRPGSTKVWECGHVDDVRTKNVLTNVRWCTRKVNFVDRDRNGRSYARPSQIINGVKHYQCTGLCKQWKADTEFKVSSVPTSVCGRESQCIPCAKIRNREYSRRRRQQRKAA